MNPALRILLICQQDLGGPPHPIPAYRFWRDYLVQGLGEAGHHVWEAPGCDWALGLCPQSEDSLTKWRAQTWDTLSTAITRRLDLEGFDLVLTYLYPQQIEENGLRELTKRGIPVVNFFCDNVREFRRVPPEFKPFTLHWVPEFGALPLYRQARLPVIHAPMPCHVPKAFRALPSDDETPPCFIGSHDNLRARLLSEAISEHNLKLQIFGRGWVDPSPASPTGNQGASSWWSNQHQFIGKHGWKAWGRKVVDRFLPPKPAPPDLSPFAGAAISAHDYVRYTRSAQVCLGINRYPSPRLRRGEIATYSRLRDIEAPMLGACYLTEDAPGIDQLYDLENEIWVYRNAAELAELVFRLQNDPSTRTRLRRGAQRRALRDHSIENSVRRIAQQLSL